MKPEIVEANHNDSTLRSLTAEEGAVVVGGQQVGGSVLGLMSRNHFYEIGVTGSYPELGHVLVTRDVVVIQDGVIMNRDEHGMI